MNRHEARNGGVRHRRVSDPGGPESCVGVCKDAGEALTGVRAGRAIEPRYHPLRGELPWVMEALRGVLTSVEPGSWIHAAVVGRLQASNSTGVSIPSDECRRWRLWKISR